MANIVTRIDQLSRIPFTETNHVFMYLELAERFLYVFAMELQAGATTIEARCATIPQASKDTDTSAKRARRVARHVRYAAVTCKVAGRACRKARVKFGKEFAPELQPKKVRSGMQVSA